MFPGASLAPSYQTCFSELITVAPTNFSEPMLNVQEIPSITIIVAGTVSAVAVLFLVVIILVVSLVFFISLWRRAQRKKYVFIRNAVMISLYIIQLYRKWDAHTIAGNLRINGSNSMSKLWMNVNNACFWQVCSSMPPMYPLDHMGISVHLLWY